MPKIRNHNFLVGADPEVFIVDKKGNPVSAYGLAPGTKEDPFRVDRGFIQVDGMALEYNVNPSNSFEEFLRNIQSVQASLSRYLPPGCKFSHDPVAQFGQEFMRQQPKEATRLGCDPDFNAYTGEQNPTPKGDVPFRTASGHIHIGWTDKVDPFDKDHFTACRELVYKLDLFLGVYLPTFDKDTVRSSLYGQLGAFRPKPYGVEYRVPSNVWTHQVSTIRLVWEAVMVSIMETFTSPPPLDKLGWGYVHHNMLASMGTRKRLRHLPYYIGNNLSKKMINTKVVVDVR